MKTLFVMDPLDRVDVTGDSTYMQMLEARRRGRSVWVCTPADLFAQGGQPGAWATPVEVARQAPHFVCGESQDQMLSEFDVVWMRKDPPFDLDYVFATYLLELAPPSTHVFNHPAALRGANEKLYGLHWPELGPPTLVTRDISRARRWVSDAPDRTVLKPWYGCGGFGVVVTHGGDENLAPILELLTNQGTSYVVAQQYVPEIKEGDKRIILVDGRPVGWMLRVPTPGDHRGNMHVGARIEACSLTDRDQEICAALAPRLKAEGLLFVGIDIIGDYLTEINVTSPTGIQEINRLMGTHLEVDIADAVADRIQKPQ